MKFFSVFAIALTLSACATAPQINQQAGVDTKDKSDVIQIGTNSYQVFRKGSGTSVSELKRSAGIAAASVCVPKGLSVKITKEDSDSSLNFFGVLTRSVLTSFICV